MQISSALLPSLYIETGAAHRVRLPAARVIPTSQVRPPDPHSEQSQAELLLQRMRYFLKLLNSSYASLGEIEFYIARKPALLQRLDLLYQPPELLFPAQFGDLLVFLFHSLHRSRTCKSLETRSEVPLWYHFTGIRYDNRYTVKIVFVVC